MGGVKGSLELDKIESMLYDVFGSDDFHDSIDQAKDAAIDDDKFVNYIGDAQAKGMAMLNNIYSDKGANAFTKAADDPIVRGRDAMSNDLEENDKALDEVIEENVFKEIDSNLETMATHMSATQALETLVGELQAMSGGTEVLHQALKNVVSDMKVGVYNNTKEE